MAGITRRSAINTGLAGLVGAAALHTRPARAAEWNFKLGVDWPSDHPGSVAARDACGRIGELTGGRVDVQFFPNNMLGSDTDMLSQVRNGALEFVLMPAGVLSTLVPVAAIGNVGFAFSGYEQVWRAMDGGLGAFARDRIDKAGLLVMDKVWDNGFRQLTTGTNPIRSLTDVKGLKIRVPVSPIFSSMWRALDAAPASANVNEVYSALQTKVFDAQENPLANIRAFKFYEVQKYCALTSHMWEGFWLLANRRVWGTMPPDIQEKVQAAFNDGAVRQRKAMAEFDQSLRAVLEKDGIGFTMPDRSPFREKLTAAGFYAQWKKSFGDEAWGRLEAVTGGLA